MTPSVLSDDEGDEAARLYRQGHTIEQLAAHFHCSPAPISRALRAREVAIRRVGKRARKAKP